MWANRFSPSKHWASNRPLPSILVTWAYSEKFDSALKKSNIISIQHLWDLLKGESIKYYKRWNVCPYLAHLHGRPVLACHRRSRSFHVSCSCHLSLYSDHRRIDWQTAQELKGVVEGVTFDPKKLWVGQMHMAVFHRNRSSAFVALANERSRHDLGDRWGTNLRHN